MRTLHLPAMAIQLAYVFAHGFGTNCFSALHHVKVEQKNIKIGGSHTTATISLRSTIYSNITFLRFYHRNTPLLVQHHTETITCNRENVFMTPSGYRLGGIEWILHFLTTNQRCAAKLPPTPFHLL